MAAGGAAALAPQLTLDRVIGQTCLHNGALAVNPCTGDVAYPAGCVVVIYQPRRNRQFRYFRAGKTVSCLAFSSDGGMLAVGERGHQPNVVVWSLATGAVLRELKNGHRFGVSCLTFGPRGDMLVSAGFKYDRMLQVWDLGLEGREKASPGKKRPEAEPSPPSPPSSAGARRVASAKVSQKVRSLAFSSDGSFLVTCGDKHVKFWYFEEEDGEEVPADSRRSRYPKGEKAEDGVIRMDGRPASILEGLRGSTFMDVVCGEEGAAFCVTSGGVLCVFSPSRVMSQWVNLEATAAYGISLYNNELLAVACSDGLLRLFSATSLEYVSTLPKPPPLGGANVASLEELAQQRLLPEGKQARYPAVLGVRLSPSGTKVVAVYADRSMFIWDITDRHNVGRYRSFLNHGACIWDVQTVPTPPLGPAAAGEGHHKGLPSNVFATCSADNTVRLWDLGSLDGASSSSSSSSSAAGAAAARWSNVYCKHLVRILYADEKEKDGLASSRNGFDDALAASVPDTEIPDSSPKPHNVLRSLAVHPAGGQLACGDKQGNIRVYDLASMRLQHTQAAHDAEVLSMAYSPVMVEAAAAVPSVVVSDTPTAGEGGESASQGVLPKPPPRWVPLHHQQQQQHQQQPPSPTLTLLASASRDRLVHVFNASANSGGAAKPPGGSTARHPLVATLENHSSSVNAIKFSQDGRRLLSAGGDKMLVINHVRGKQVTRHKAISVPQGTIYGLDVDPTNKYMVSAGQDKRLNIWNMSNGRHVRGYRPEGASAEMYRVDLDPAGMYAATCSFDKWIRLFDFYSGRCLAKVAGHSELVTGLRFSGDGKRLISIGGDGCIFVWRLSTDLQKAMKERLHELHPERPLSPAGVEAATAQQPQLVVQQLEKGAAAGSSGGGGGADAAAQEAKLRLKFTGSNLPAWAQQTGKGLVVRSVEGAAAGESGPATGKESGKRGKWTAFSPGRGKVGKGDRAEGGGGREEGGVSEQQQQQQQQQHVETPALALTCTLAPEAASPENTVVEDTCVSPTESGESGEQEGKAHVTSSPRGEPEDRAEEGTGKEVPPATVSPHSEAGQASSVASMASSSLDSQDLRLSHSFNFFHRAQANVEKEEMNGTDTAGRVGGGEGTTRSTQTTLTCPPHLLSRGKRQRW